MLSAAIRSSDRLRLTRRRAIEILLALPALSLAARRSAAAPAKVVTSMIDLIGLQNMMIQKIFKEMLLIALGVQRQENLQALRRSRERFEQAVSDLRHDPSLKPLLLDPAIAAHRAKMADLWPPFDDMILSGLTAGQVSHNLVDALAELDPLLSATTSATLGHLFERAAATPRTASLARSLTAAAGQRTLSQSMAKEFLLIAYHYDAAGNRLRLTDSTAAFEATLKAMIEGDPVRRLIPAPTAAIRSKLEDIASVWGDHAPIIRAVAEGGQPPRNLIAEAARQNTLLLRGMEQAVTLYTQL